MSLFAHIESGKALEPQPAASALEYVRLVGGGRDTSGWNVAQVPAGTLHDATANGDGTYTNPTTPSVTGPITIDRELLLARMEAIDVAAFTAAITDPRLSYFFGRIATVDSYHRDASELQLGLSLMVALGHWTQAQSDSFLSSWPTN